MGSKGEANWKLERTPENEFRRCYIAPRACQHAFKHCRSIVTFDGTAIKSRYKMLLLVAVTLDANEETLPLAWGIVPIENKDNWMWFMCQFSWDFIINTSTTAIISDREKGIVQAVTEYASKAHHYHCCQHLAENVKASYGLACSKLF